MRSERDSNLSPVASAPSLLAECIVFYIVIGMCGTVLEAAWILTSDNNDGSEYNIEL